MTPQRGKTGQTSGAGPRPAAASQAAAGAFNNYSSS